MINNSCILCNTCTKTHGHWEREAIQILENTGKISWQRVSTHREHDPRGDSS